MAGPGIITLITDFGLSDPFVGIMKGVILGRFPGAQIVDLSHGIPPQAVVEAAFWLERSHAWFPAGSVHVAVVDPGVGSTRPILALEARGQRFLAPDNGLLPDSLVESPGARLHRVDLERLALPPLALPAPSATFHGRDIFAPIAAALASGAVDLPALGEPSRAHPCLLPAPARDAEAIHGQVVTVDRFGNLITNLGRDLIEAQRSRYVLLGERAIRIVHTYSEARPGELLALINAFEVVEVARRDGSAEAHLGLGRGAPVRVPLHGQLIRA